MLGSVADVRDFAQVNAALGAGVEHFGRLDIVCANAGIATMAFRELTIEEELEQWTDVLDVNLVGAFHTAKAAIPHLLAGQRGGSIVFTSSTAGLRGFGGLQGGGLAYAASKHGIVGLMRTLGQCACPGEYPGQHRASDSGEHDDGRQPCDDVLSGELSRRRAASAESDAGRTARAGGHQRGDRLSGLRCGEVRHRGYVPGGRRLLQQAVGRDDFRNGTGRRQAGSGHRRGPGHGSQPCRAVGRRRRRPHSGRHL